MKSFFILPLYNKEHLVIDVLHGIIQSCVNDYHVVCIVDGCTDSTEDVLQHFITNAKIENKFTILKMNNVHEITCLNYGLTQIKLFHPHDDDLIFTVQDDVIIQEPQIDEKFAKLFQDHTDLGYVSMRLGSTIVYMQDSIGEANYIESEFGHWNQLGLTHYTKLQHGAFIQTQLAIRSPTCVQWKRYKEVGFYDAALAPCGYDCHDFSIRMIQHGYKNGVYALKFRSDVAWGGMRTPTPSEINKKHGEIYEWNRRYLAVKHRSFLLAKSK